MKKTLTKPKPTLFFLSILLICTLFSGCVTTPLHQNDFEKFLGAWSGYFFLPINPYAISVDPLSVRFTFQENGTYLTAKNSLRYWKLQDNKILLYTNQSSLSFSYKFSNNNTHIYLYGASGDVYLSKV
jgi:hypothetical protein